MESTGKRVGADLTEGPVLRSLLRFAVPMILASVLQQLYSAVDLMIIGQYMENVGTIAVSTGGEFTDSMTMVAMAFAVGAQVYIAQLVGAKDEGNLRSAVGTTLTMLGAGSLVILLLAILFHKQFLDLMNCPGIAREEAAGYMIITACGLPFVFGYNGISAVLRGMGESKKPLLFVAVAASVNVAADFLLVVVIPLGVVGTAIATVLSQIGSFTAALIYLYRHRNTFDFKLSLSYFRIDRKALLRILRMAVPQLIRSLSVHGSMLWVKSQVNVYGDIASSTYSIGSKIEKFMQVFISGVDGAAGAMIGQNIGARKHGRVKKIMWETLGLNLLICAAVVSAFLFLPHQLYRLFTVNEDVIEMGQIFLRIMSLGMVVVALASCFKSIATGSGAALLSLVLGILDGVSRILVCLLFYYVFDQGVQSYFWGAAFCMLLPGLISFVYFISGKWKRKKLLSEL